MAIIGIESLIYGVDDLNESVRYFEDFGLSLVHRSDSKAEFQVENGASVIFRLIDDPALPETSVVGIGVREVIWGVDSEVSLEDLAEKLSGHVKTRIGDDGVIRFNTPCGLAMGLKVFKRKPVVTAPDALNSPGRVNRLNSHRRWRRRALPKTIGHVVFGVKDFWASFGFLKEVLDFRLSDYQEGYGAYARADGSNNHHDIFFLDAALKLPGMDGQPRFHHANFGVEDIDEIMIGANHMTRQGWEKSHFGLGRHRIDSALFFYIPCPAGGEAEYGADGDALDDTWLPREWNAPIFGYLTFAHEVPPFFMQEPEWVVKYFDESTAPWAKKS